MAHDWQKDVHTLIYRFKGKNAWFLMIVVLLLIVGLCTGGLPAEAARLENPGDGQVYSGIGIISGWKCDADGPLTVRFNGGPPIPLVYGSERTDTRSVCSDTNNGFVALWNWGHLRAGTHTARVYDNGVMFAKTMFEVGTLGVEFLRGFEGEVYMSGGYNLGLAWNENTQHFEVGTGQVWDHDSERESAEQFFERGREYEERREQLKQRPPGWHAKAARLENPGDGQLYSGIGIISGWKCEADGPLTVRFNDSRSIPLVYGSERTDTRSVCGDANNGFVALWNWAHMGDGIHTARVYDNGVAFAETTFQVGTVGVEFWDGLQCNVANPDVCWVVTTHSTLTRHGQFGYGHGPAGYDGEWCPAPGTGFDRWWTYFKWNANTQHFEAFARRRYQPSRPPTPPYAWIEREPSFEDRPDDFGGPQIHVYHAFPRDVRGGGAWYTGAVVQDAQRWLATRTYQGRAFRIDTHQDRPDVTTLPLNVTTAEMQVYNKKTILDAPILQGGLSLRDMASHDPNKLHVVFIKPSIPARDDDEFFSDIGGVAYPSAGVAVIKASSYLTLIFLHEVFHLLGAVHPDAPHSDGTAHIERIRFGIDEGSFDEDGHPLGKVGFLSKRRDLMQPKADPGFELDIGSDDYYFHPEKTSHWPPPHYDTVDSPYFTDGPWTDITCAASSHALRASPPEGQPAIAPDNPSEAAPYPALPEPQPEGQGGLSGEWCGGVVD